MLGSGGVIVLDDSVDMVEAAANLAHFYAHESCGQCTPCREGADWCVDILERIVEGHGRPEDPELLLRICTYASQRHDDLPARRRLRAADLQHGQEVRRRLRPPHRDRDPPPPEEEAPVLPWAGGLPGFGH